jgi:mannopine transport system permease protein
VQLLLESFGTGSPTLAHYHRVFAEPLYVAILLRTLRVAATVTALSLLLGYPVAYYMTRCRGWAFTLMTVSVLLPLWTNVLVRSYAWTILLQRNGIANTLLRGLGLIDQPLPLLYTEPAMVVAMTQVLLPFMVLPLYSTLRNVPHELPRAARNLGADPRRTFLHVTLPLSLPGVVSGGVLVFVMALGFYITPALIGGPRSLMIGPLIYQQATQLVNWPFAAALGVVLLAVTLALIGLLQRTLGLQRVMHL